MTADWRYLLMLNYQVDPAVLVGRLPEGCELDNCTGRTFVSVVGFQFLKTRVLGVPIPFHRNFDEVNLRFYVRRKAAGVWRRGVVFLKELVPRAAIALTARKLYGENYWAVPMRHTLRPPSPTSDGLVQYEWRVGSTWEGLHAEFSGEPVVPAEDSEQAFITEHYWGYSSQPRGGTVEYQVEHPRWAVWRAENARLVCDVLSLYGEEFVEPLKGAPSTAFVADGSPVLVRVGREL